MRLIHNKTLKLDECHVAGSIPFAILSHTWGEGEVSFQETQNGTAYSKQGYGKIRRCCEIAAADGFEYSWVDTCCIDKTSSAELSEAINSMYQWYRAAGVCYVYLADVPTGLGLDSRVQAIRMSRWFSRGWTLQELLAPESVIFFDNQWEELGTKDTLRGLISDITRIDKNALKDESNAKDFSVAQKMSWASRRETTRVEDLAYCLMGIFGVNMPMLYGEGERAFIRLQEEIMKTTDDHTIFAWSNRDSFNSWGLLAHSPADFGSCGSTIRIQNPNSRPFSSTNKGIHLNVPVGHTEWYYRKSPVISAMLDCRILGEESKVIGIYLTKTLSPDGDGFNRVMTDEIGRFDIENVWKLEWNDIFVKQREMSLDLPLHDHLYLNVTGLAEHGIMLETLDPAAILTGEFVRLPVSYTKSMIASFRFTDQNGNGFDIGFHIAKKAQLVDTQINWLAEEQPGNVEMPMNSWNNQGYDRVLWQHPLKRWWICVSIRRTIVLRKRSKTINISWHTPRVEMAGSPQQEGK
ncbi:hypothetical protein GLAREA_02932 [Glarea lozoyensis ATCC 20868]|uniref:Uncharacterized protein n=1 Tax=Glarea lozoyensis (strain ATCC 20868 / MF5171) TaxID=1116229 RepID=S3DKD7_GLAL2|nr:uncharacterized protein GLAREA_02932 [Glarea lozoyensis ATCC 20868]EPE27018.1 hypothetical protein GLAREA_02932 [Glarea lozoyensis ATCC 20868]